MPCLMPRRPPTPKRAAPQQARVASVTANTFSVVAQPPLLGRDFEQGTGLASAPAVTGVGVSALKMRVKRACERLRDLLSDTDAS